MGGKPKVVKQDPEGDALRAANKATAEANAKRASRRLANSTGSASSVLAPTGDSGTGFLDKGSTGARINDLKDKVKSKTTLGGG
ncbi:MAG: hypothetical protein RR605_00590 [Acinetobacter sp.]